MPRVKRENEEMCQRLLLRLMALAYATMTSCVCSHRGNPSMADFFRVTLGLTPPFKKDEHRPIKVIGAGLPRTGTASFVMALRKLGLLVHGKNVIDRNSCW